MWRRVGTVIGVGLVLASCGRTEEDAPNGIACQAGALRCDGQSVKVCDEAGTSEKTRLTCPPETFCRIKDSLASCDAQACTPGQAICNDTVATTCKADGSGPAPGGTDCTDSAQSCQNGVCHTGACSSRGMVCQNNLLYTCAGVGQNPSFVKECATGEACTSDASACGPALCDGGSCSQITVCTPGAETCIGTQVARCNVSGSGWLAPETCTGGEICSEGSCQSTVHGCTPGAKVCLKDLVATCNADGSFPMSGTACASDEQCLDGECKPRPCEPGVVFCRNSDVYLCQNGAPAALVEACGSGRACQALVPGSSAHAAACLPLPCAPGETTCVQNQLGTCAADGKSLSQLSEDCIAEDSVCTVDGRCLKFVTDLVGPADPVAAGETSSAETLVANVIRVHTSRKLQELQTYIGARVTPVQLRWLVYEQIDNAFVAKVEAVVTNQLDLENGVADVKDFPLEAGKTYLLGWVLSPGETTLTTPTSNLANLSFGVVVGRLVVPYAPSIDIQAMDTIQTDVASFMRVGTASP